VSKFNPLWKYVAETEQDLLRLSYEDIERISGVPIDHSFLSYKKELLEYGYQVGKISMRNRNVEFIRIK